MFYFSRKLKTNLNEETVEVIMRKLKVKKVLEDETFVVTCPRCKKGIFIYPMADDGTDNVHAHLPNSNIKVKHSSKKGVFELQPSTIVCINREANKYCDWSGDVYLTN